MWSEQVLLGKQWKEVGKLGQGVSGKENGQCRDARAGVGGDKCRRGTGGWPRALQVTEGLWLLLWRHTGRFCQSDIIWLSVLKDRSSSCVKNRPKGKGGSRWEEVTAAAQVKDEGSSERLGFWIYWRVEPTGLVDELDVGYERRVKKLQTSFSSVPTTTKGTASLWCIGILITSTALYWLLPCIESSQ